MKTKTLLAVLAHPDDESFGMGGTLALYALRGVDVYLVCATRGEAGEADAEHLKGFSSVAELRESELRCAAGILGLKGVFFLGYRDSGMPGAVANHHPQALIRHSVEDVAGRVVKYIRELKPNVVLTFDPIGGYRHPDHIHIHQATTLAFKRANDPGFYPEAGSPFAPQALYYHTIPHTFLKAAVFLLRLFGKDPRKFGKNGDIDLVSIAEVNFPVHARINIRPVWTKKEQASACHSSQGGRSNARGWRGLLARLFAGEETFMRAYPPVEGKRIIRDLFLF
ncbi:MAG: PIG-L family deacetylase [Anaerolineales bacterium]|nr:PIG-L family deacetylase [Anaerolineales bacterium]MDW8226911.1 PIG-L family deacetylase [Anaerolineales bacterium]